MLPVFQNLMVFFMNFPTAFRSIGSAHSFSELKEYERIQHGKDVNHLTITPHQQKVIYELLKELATSHILTLGWHASRLTTTGLKLKEEVHPYRFLLEILLTPPPNSEQHSSKDHLKMIREDSSDLLRSRIWSDFTFNLGKNFEDRKKDIAHYRESFAKTLGVDASQLEVHEEAKKWDILVDYLLESSKND